MSKSAALTYVQLVWTKTRIRGSFQRLNTAMFHALKSAIEADLEFNVGDLGKMPGIGRWLGGGDETLYKLACGAERGIQNVSAALAFEKYFGRLPWLWAEETKSPGRLYIGSQFTWAGEFVTVTSFNDDKATLIACTYTDNEADSSDGLKVGGIGYFRNGYRKVEALHIDEDDTVCVRFSPKVEHDRTIARRFTITHDELVAKRKEYDGRRKKYEQQIAAAETMIQIDAIGVAATAEGKNAYRHFDLDILWDAFKARGAAINEKQSAAEAEAYELYRAKEYAQLVERWVAGEDVHLPLRSEPTIRVRVKGNRVEVSNGNSVTLTGARTALAFVLGHRAAGWEANGSTFDVDAFKVKRVHPTEGVTIGCTHFDWPEVERFQTLLAA